MEEPENSAPSTEVEPREPDREGKEFPCDNCGANMTWDPAVDSLGCAYCGHRVAVPRDEGLVVERALEDVGDALRGFGVEVRVTKCKNCGARVTFDEHSTSELCVYCGSANVLSQEANRNALRPESLVPLDVSHAEVRERFRDWIEGRWFRPTELKKTRNFDAVGIYVPFWAFDCEVHSDWSADSGTYYYVNQPYVVMVNGKPTMRMRRVRKVRWRPAWGKRDDSYDDLLIHASLGLAPKLAAKLGGFDTRGLVPYRPEYLAGWRAEEYQVDLSGGWEKAQSQVVDRQRSLCGADVPGDTFRNLRVQNHIHDVFWKHALFPVWSLQYRFRGKTYTVLINGQSGKIAGEAPLSWTKILLLVGGILFGVFLFVVVAGVLGAL